MCLSFDMKRLVVQNGVRYNEVVLSCVFLPAALRALSPKRRVIARGAT